MLFLSPDTSNGSSVTRPPRRLHSCSQASVTTHFPLATALRNLALRTLALEFLCTVPQTTWVTASVYLGSTVQPRLIFGGGGRGGEGMEVRRRVINSFRLRGDVKEQQGGREAAYVQGERVGAI